MNKADLARLRLSEDDRVDVTSAAGEMRGMLARAFDVPAGNCAMYYPEANALIPRIADPASHTPVFKSVAVHVRKAAVRDQEPVDAHNGGAPRAAGKHRELKPC